MKLYNAKIKNLKYLLPVIPLAFVAMAAAIQQTGPQSAADTLDVSTSAKTSVETDASPTAPKTDVTVNGQNLDLGRSGTAQIETDDTSVTVSGGTTTTTTVGGRTVTTNDDGSVNISVGSSSNNSSSKTKVELDGGTDFEWDNDSKIEIKHKGEGGNIHINTND